MNLRFGGAQRVVLQLSLGVFFFAFLSCRSPWFRHSLFFEMETIPDTKVSTLLLTEDGRASLAAVIVEIGKLPSQPQSFDRMPKSVQHAIQALYDNKAIIREVFTEIADAKKKEKKGSPPYVISSSLPSPLTRIFSFPFFYFFIFFRTDGAILLEFFKAMGADGRFAWVKTNISDYISLPSATAPLAASDFIIAPVDMSVQLKSGDAEEAKFFNTLAQCFSIEKRGMILKNWNVLQIGKMLILLKALKGSGDHSFVQGKERFQSWVCSVLSFIFFLFFICTYYYFFFRGRSSPTTSSPSPRFPTTWPLPILWRYFLLWSITTGP
jgi:hypothetical protein